MGAGAGADSAFSWGVLRRCGAGAGAGAAAAAAGAAGAAAAAGSAFCAGVQVQVLVLAPSTYHKAIHASMCQAPLGWISSLP